MKKELKLVFLEKNKFENRVEVRVSDNKNFWQFHFHDINEGLGLIVFLLNFPPRMEKIRLRRLVE